MLRYNESGFVIMCFSIVYVSRHITDTQTMKKERNNQTSFKLRQVWIEITGGWRHLNWGGRPRGNGRSEISGMVSNTSNTLV